jgi:hypothetical protein
VLFVLCYAVHLGSTENINKRFPGAPSSYYFCQNEILFNERVNEWFVIKFFFKYFVLDMGNLRNDVECFFSEVPEFIDPVFANTCPKPSFSVIEKECFGLFFAKTGSINLGT